MSQSMNINENKPEKSDKSGASKIPNLKLPNLNIGKGKNTLNSLNRRYASVKDRNNLSRSPTLKNSLDNIEEIKLPNAHTTIAAALPLALIKKQKMLEKSEEDDEINIKKLIKVNSPKEYHGLGISKQELLTGIEPINTNPKIVHGKSYVISISPSQKNYERNKKQIVRPQSIMKKANDSFNIEEQYENRAICRQIKYNDCWHPVFCQSATLTNLNSKLYLIGGVSHAIIQQVCQLSCSSKEEFEWSIFKTQDSILQRYGHT